MTETTFQELFNARINAIGAALKLKMDVEKRDFRSLAKELRMPASALSNIALGTLSSQRSVPNFERYLRVQHWLGMWPARKKDAPATLIDVIMVIDRMDWNERTKLLAHALMRAVYQNLDDEDAA